MTPVVHGTQVVAGGGLAGLLIADRLRAAGADVVVIESEATCGGLLRSFDYGAEGRFDYGTHILSETGVPGLDAWLRALLPENDWHFLTGVRRDLAGVYWNGHLQKHSLYPDLTTLPRDEYGLCLADFFAHLDADASAGDDARDARSYLEQRFGPRIAERVGVPMVERFGGAPADALSLLATKLCPLNRVALFGRTTAQELAHTPRLSKRIAYVDQREIPLSARSPLAAFYPRVRGIGRTIEALVARLRSEGVRVLTGARIARIERTAGLRVRLAPTGDVVDTGHLWWAASPLGLAPLLDVPFDARTHMDAPRSTVLCHFRVPGPPVLDDVFYAYCADAPMRTYRITNYAAFCPEPAREPREHALTVELVVEHPSPPEGGWEALALRELRTMGIVPEGVTPPFARSETLAYGFPRPTLRNERGMDVLRDAICASFGASAVSLHGLGARAGTFFLVDVLREAWTALAARGLCQ